GVAPRRVLQSVASGVLGPDASFHGGWRSALLGLGLHFFIATTMAVTYYLFARRWPGLWERPWLYGPLFGLLLFRLVHSIVVPLSQALSGSPNTVWIVLSIVVHAFLIGTPIALFTRRAMLATPVTLSPVPVGA